MSRAAFPCKDMKCPGCKRKGSYGVEMLGVHPVRACDGCGHRQLVRVKRNGPRLFHLRHNKKAPGREAFPNAAKVRA